MFNFKNLSILALPVFVFSCNSGIDFFDKKIAPNSNTSNTPKPISTKLPNSSELDYNIRPNTTQSSWGDDGAGGSTSDIKDRATFNGKVYDINNNPVDGATVTAKSIEAGVSWIGETTQTIGGSYVFRTVPSGARIEISVTKDGWTTRTRSEVLKANLKGDPNANVFDFGFDGTSSSTDENGLYAIQDNPEVVALRINGKSASDSATGIANKTESSGNPDFVGYSPATTGVSTDNLIIEMFFSEPVNKEDVQNYFRVVSSVGTSINSNGSFKGALTNQKSIIIDKTYPTVTFDWSADSKSVMIKTNKGLLSNADISDIEARYLIDFSSPIRDINLLKSNPKRTFCFSANKLGGFHLFSVKNQNQAPYITDFTAINGTSGSDYLKLKFNLPMDVVGRSSLAALLSDPKVSNPVIDNNLESLSNANSTLLGYHDVNSNNFVPVYQVAIIKPNTTTTASALNIGNGMGATTSNLIKSAIIDSNNPNTIIIELPQNAFNINDKIILSAGGQLSGMYTGNKTNNFSSLDFKTGIPLPSSNNFEELTDPSGKTLDRNGLVVSGYFSTSNAQKIATAG